MPLITPQPEQAVPAKMANSWRMSAINVTLPPTGIPVISMTVVAEMVAEDGAVTFVNEEAHIVPPQFMLPAMTATTTGQDSIYNEFRAGAYAVAQAMGAIPADAAYQGPTV